MKFQAEFKEKDKIVSFRFCMKLSLWMNILY